LARPSVSLIVPTWRAGRWLPRLLQALRAQTQPPGEILVIDSASDDGTAQLAREAGCRVEVIAQESFNHGATRNQAALRVGGEILVFMTQDALPANEEFLAALVRPIAAGAAAATYARQLPRAEATPPERFQRHYQYPERGRRAAEGTGVAFVYFCSNSAAAVGRAAFHAVGGFPPHVPCCEDIVLSAKLHQAGYATQYVPEAAVVHSHNLALQAQFRRYFDTGVAFAQAEALLRGARPNADGRRYALSLLGYLAREREWGWLAFACAELGAKWAGYHLGRRERLVPQAWKPVLSQQPSYWRGARPSAWLASDPRLGAAAGQARAAAVGEPPA